MLNNKILFFYANKKYHNIWVVSTKLLRLSVKKKSKTLNLIVQFFVLQNKRFDIDIVFRTQVLHNT